MAVGRSSSRGPTMSIVRSRLSPEETQAGILLIEDDEEIGQRLVDGLGAAGYSVRWSRTGENGLSQARHEAPGVTLLDLGLPDVDGVDVARRLRAEHPTMLLIILTARSDDMDVVIGLDAGADDYLTKPFSLTVLLARLRAHLRTRPTPADHGPLRVGTLQIDANARRCFVVDQEVSLRPKEFDLVHILAVHAGVAVSREDLMAQVWDENWFGPTKTLDVTMAALRRALLATAQRVGAELPQITTLRGHGYRLENSGSS